MGNSFTVVFVCCLFVHAGGHVSNGVPAQAKAPAAGNLFWKSPVWKRQIVQDVSMLPRGEMYCPLFGGASKLRIDAHITDIQEFKQAICQQTSSCRNN